MEERQCYGMPSNQTAAGQQLASEVGVHDGRSSNAMHQHQPITSLPQSIQYDSMYPNVSTFNRTFGDERQFSAPANDSTYDTGLHGTPRRPVPKPRPPRLQATDDKKTAERVPVERKPRPPPRPPSLTDARTPCTDLDTSAQSETGPRHTGPSQSNDTVDSIPFYRRNIEELIKENRLQKDKFEAACSVMKVQCSLNSKYESIELWDILNKNKHKDVNKIPQSFTILEKYATNLLKDEKQRHPSWRMVQFSSQAYQTKVKFMDGAIDILRSLGYTQEVMKESGDFVGLSFPPGTSVNSRIVLNIAVDLVIAQFEVEAMLMGEHPREKLLKTVEDVPPAYFPVRNLAQPITSDESSFEDINSSSYKNTELALPRRIIIPKCPTAGVVEPPALPPRKNQQPRSPAIAEDYKKQLKGSPGRYNAAAVPSENYGESSSAAEQHHQQPVHPVLNLPNKPQNNDQRARELTCLKCSSKFDLTAKFCSECGSSLKLTSLPFENDTSLPCENDEPPVQMLQDIVLEDFNEAESVESDGWNCEHCTLLNSYDSLSCSACFKTSSVSRARRQATKPAEVTKPDVRKRPPGVAPTVAENAYDAHMFASVQSQYNKDSSMLQSANDVDINAKLRQVKIQMEEETRQRRLKEEQEAEAKRLQILKEQNEMKENAARVVAHMKFCELHGYTVEECLLAQQLHEGQNQHLLLNWLQNDWKRLIEDVVKLCIEQFERDESVGAISRDEAKKLLLETEGDKVKVVPLFFQRRKEQVTKIAKLQFEKKDAIVALCETGGDVEKATQMLNKRKLQIFYDSMKKESTPEDFDRLQDVTVPLDVRTRSIMVENGVSWGRAGFVFRLIGDIDEGCATIGDIVKFVRANKEYQNTYDECKRYFGHECGICFSEFSHNDINIGLACSCEICNECYSNFIKVTVGEKHIRHLVCQICFKPDIEVGDTHMYFSMISNQINDLIKKNLIPKTIKENFESKLLDYHLKKKENFRWCLKCKNGFEWEQEQIRMQCDRCHLRMCFLCRQEWADQHEGITCDQFRAWKDANDPKRQEMGVQALLHGRGIECPECKAAYELAQGGCMHFTCTECSYDFCSGCNKGMKKGGQCSVHKTCVNKGLHTHHPRDCLYYLRDSEVKDLESLLADNAVEWKREYPPDMQANERHVCGVDLQKDTEDGGLRDEPCGAEAPQNMAGFCIKHYKEYLVVLINNNAIDPVNILDIQSLNTCLGRHFIATLVKDGGETDEHFKTRLKAYLVEQLPLPRRQDRQNVPVVAGNVAAGNLAAQLGAVAAGLPDLED